MALEENGGDVDIGGGQLMNRVWNGNTSTITGRSRLGASRAGRGWCLRQWRRCASAPEHKNIEIKVGLMYIQPTNIT